MQRTVLVTGASRGLGKEIAVKFAEKGFLVGINYLSSEDEARKLAGAIGQRAVLMKGDVGDVSDVAQIERTISEKWGRLDVLVNNAAVAQDALLVRQSEAVWDEVMKTNLKGCFNTVKALAPIMVDTGGGHVINISSLSGIKGRTGQAAYSASKAALIGLTRTLARELAPAGIRVNAVAPGYLATDMGASSPDAMERAKNESLLGRLADVSETAAFVVWVAGSDGITGQVLRPDSRL